MGINPTSNEELLECYSEVLSHLKEMHNEDIMVLITNKTHMIHYYPGNKMVINEEIVGKELPVKNQILEAMKSSKIMSTIINQEAFGFPFSSLTYPIKNINGEVWFTLKELTASFLS